MENRVTVTLAQVTDQASSPIPASPQTGENWIHDFFDVNVHDGGNTSTGSMSVDSGDHKPELCVGTDSSRPKEMISCSIATMTQTQDM